MLLKGQITPLSPAGCNVDNIPLLDHCVDILQTTCSYYLGEYSDWTLIRFFQEIAFFKKMVCSLTLRFVWTTFELLNIPLKYLG